MVDESIPLTNDKSELARKELGRNCKIAKITWEKSYITVTKIRELFFDEEESS